MLVGLLEKVELSAEIEARLSVSAEELRTVLTEPDLVSATHHDLESIMNAFSGETLSGASISVPQIAVTVTGVAAAAAALSVIVSAPNWPYA